jgi:predicted kinase
MVKNKELIILVGISGSGKSTWAGEYINNNTNILRLNRDDIRKSLVQNLKGYYQREDLTILEDIVSTTIYNLFISLIVMEKSIILDNTNLKKEYFKGFIRTAVRNGYNIKFKLFDYDLDGAKRRILNRDYNTWCDDGALKTDPKIISQTEYIDKQYKQYRDIKRYILKEYTHLIMY